MPFRNPTYRVSPPCQSHIISAVYRLVPLTDVGISVRPSTFSIAVPCSSCTTGAPPDFLNPLPPHTQIAAVLNLDGDCGWAMPFPSADSSTLGCPSCAPARTCLLLLIILLRTHIRAPTINMPATVPATVAAMADEDIPILVVCVAATAPLLVGAASFGNTEPPGSVGVGSCGVLGEAAVGAARWEQIFFLLFRR